MDGLIRSVVGLAVIAGGMVLLQTWIDASPDAPIPFAAPSAVAGMTASTTEPMDTSGVIAADPSGTLQETGVWSNTVDGLFFNVHVGYLRDQPSTAYVWSIVVRHPKTEEPSVKELQIRNTSGWIAITKQLGPTLIRLSDEDGHAWEFDAATQSLRMLER